MMDIIHERKIRKMRLDPIAITIAKIKKTKTAKKRPSRNARMDGIKLRNKYGIDIPNTIADARRLDEENSNGLWMEAIRKELEALEKLNVFKYHKPGKRMGNEHQYAPMRFVFDVKWEDLRRKARLVLAGVV